MEELGRAMAGRVRAFVGPDASLALVGPLGELLWSSMDDEEAAYISDIVRKLSGFLSRGDYYVGSLKGKKVIVLKATDKVCLALVAEAKEGVMLYALRSLLNAFLEKINFQESLGTYGFGLDDADTIADMAYDNLILGNWIKGSPIKIDKKDIAEIIKKLV